MADAPRTTPQPGNLVPSSWAALKPILEDVIIRWHVAEARIGDWTTVAEFLPPTQAEGWAAQTEVLQLINTFQWHEEDKSRDLGVKDTVLAETKRTIDASNRRRVQAVDKLDDLIHAGLSEAGAVDATAPLNSESPGSIIDRLTVLALKIHHVAEARDILTGDQATAMGRRLTGLVEQRDDLGQCLDALLDGIRAGRVGLKLYRQVKVYREAATGALRADLEEN